MKSEIRKEYAEAVQRSIDSILQQLDTNVDWLAIANDSGFSPYHFHRIFRALTSETPTEMLRRCRLERAAYLLKYTEVSVGEVSIDASFGSHEAFTRAFKQEFGVPPQDWRANSRYEYRIRCENGVHFMPHGESAKFFACDLGVPQMNVEIKEVPSRRVASLRHVGPYPMIGATFGRLYQTLAPYGLAQTEYAAIYYSSPDVLPEDQLQSDACAVILNDASIPEGLTEQTIQAGKYAVYRHVGDYSLLGSAWDRFAGEWLPTSGYEVSDALCFELYVNSLMEVGPTNAITDLYIGVK
jgi:AraC family transcriptional regulator